MSASALIVVTALALFSAFGTRVSKFHSPVRASERGLQFVRTNCITCYPLPCMMPCMMPTVISGRGIGRGIGVVSVQGITVMPVVKSCVMPVVKLIAVPMLIWIRQLRSCLGGFELGEDALRFALNEVVSQLRECGKVQLFFLLAGKF